MNPFSPEARETPVKGHAWCWYCERAQVVEDGVIVKKPKAVRATTVVHDPRGCVPCCDEHTKWRRTTSMGIGHGTNCPERRRTE